MARLRPSRTVITLAVPAALTALTALSGCTPRAFTPNARAFAFDSPTAPAVGDADVQGDIARIGSPFGPELANGGVRYRRGLRPGLVGEVEGGFLHLTNDGSGGSRNAVTGRGGVMLHTSADELRTALTLGVGGGLSPAAGQWASFDFGVAIGGSHRWLRPFVGGDVSYNAAFGSRPFTVAEPDGEPVTLVLPDTITTRATAGVEIGPPHLSGLIGFSIAQAFAREPDRVGASERHDDTVLALGVGVRVALDQR